MCARRSYDTDLSDKEWRIFEPLVPSAKPGGQARRSPASPRNARAFENAIFFYVLRGGCAWRLLPHDFSLPWQTAYHYFRAWRMDGTWDRMHAVLPRERLRRLAGKEPTPSAAIVVDSQTAKTTERGGLRGYDGAARRSAALQAAFAR